MVKKSEMGKGNASEEAQMCDPSGEVKLLRFKMQRRRMEKLIKQAETTFHFDLLDRKKKNCNFQSS